MSAPITNLIEMARARGFFVPEGTPESLVRRLLGEPDTSSPAQVNPPDAPAESTQEPAIAAAEPSTPAIDDEFAIVPGQLAAKTAAREEKAPRPKSPGSRARQKQKRVGSKIVTKPRRSEPPAETPAPAATTDLGLNVGRPSPAFQFYPADWLSSTKVALMTLAEQGAYLRLLCHAWASLDCGLPDNDEILAALSNLGEAWSKGGSQKLRKCFISAGGRVYNSRLLQERNKQNYWREKGREGGFASGEARRRTKFEKKDASALKGGSLTSEKQPQKPSPTKGGLSETKGGCPRLQPFCLHSSEKKKTLSSVSNETDSSSFDQWFAEFWEIYPRKVAKADAKKAAKRAIKKHGAEIVLAGLRRHLPSLHATERRFIQYPATWLNGERFLEDPEPVGTSEASPPVRFYTPPEPPEES